MFSIQPHTFIEIMCFMDPTEVSDQYWAKEIEG